MAVFGDAPLFSAGQDALSTRLDRSLAKLHQVSGPLHDTCDVMDERNCIIIFENRLEIAVPHFPNAGHPGDLNQPHAYPLRDVIRPVARDLQTEDVQNVSGGASDP